FSPLHQTVPSCTSTQANRRPNATDVMHVSHVPALQYAFAIHAVAPLQHDWPTSPHVAGVPPTGSNDSRPHAEAKAAITARSPIVASIRRTHERRDRLSESLAKIS